MRSTTTRKLARWKHDAPKVRVNPAHVIIRAHEEQQEFDLVFEYDCPRCHHRCYGRELCAQPFDVVSYSTPCGTVVLDFVDVWAAARRHQYKPDPQ